MNQTNHDNSITTRTTDLPKTRTSHSSKSNFQKTIVVIVITNSLSFKYERNYSFSNQMGGGQKDQFVLKLFAQEVGETLLILILKETHDMGDAQKRNFVLNFFDSNPQGNHFADGDGWAGGGDKNTKKNICHPSRGERRRDHKPSDISVRRVRVICCSIQVLQQPGVNTIAASHLLRLLLLLLLTMCTTGLWKERNSSDKNVTNHPQKKIKNAERNAS
jgi:hypothetical protein